MAGGLWEMVGVLDVFSLRKAKSEVKEGKKNLMT